MAYKDIQDFIQRLEAEGELCRITQEVDPYLEITEITDRVSKAGGPALLFERVKGSEYPVLMNAMGSYKRMAMALGVGNLEEKQKEIDDLIKWGFSQAKSIDIASIIPKLSIFRSFFPKKVRKAACQEVIDHNPDLSKLPVLTCWPQDGGPFFTLPLVFTRDPETGVSNLGMYRMQVFDKNTTGMHWHIHKDGSHFYQKYKERNEMMPVAVALGCDPAITYAATAPLPEGIYEILFAGFLRGKPVDMVDCVTILLQVPADAEFVLEGYVDPQEKLHTEGPFGDHTGYYSLQGEYPVFHVQCITHKKKPIYPATVVGKPPMEDCFMAKATERLFLPLLQLVIPEIVDLELPLSGVFHNCAIVSIKKRFPGQVKKVMYALWGLGQMMYTKMIIVVDADVDVHDLSTVMWKVFNNIDGKRDVVFSEGPLDALDHASPLPLQGTRLGIDATKKTPLDGHTRLWPDDIVMDSAVVRHVDEIWDQLGIEV
ncbi:menaquinone biosynthesis decarboxylase, SCO4490 family [Sphaerochaeta pleomorpha str. Grapes]|uniref:Menaquinone biosynthesis decarboxylase, SCO4490 family n=1 Tax=Sphaerochaeta pleomorpha (strain ATCC BAA-1885 / DSM 22778 / Grapes) TaxID=158190 RepID=G8QQ70_SPHPG|nr:menaquinone biosynthesis decarboxylase [Sphaerochaeta pleomorpha]AEV28647.1 menaquinone biosynthesis decarboxylase, SCO4490 family [Sphaerochaeta pleomorpha str. Grapes]